MILTFLPDTWSIWKIIRIQCIKFNDRYSNSKVEKGILKSLNLKPGSFTKNNDISRVMPSTKNCITLITVVESNGHKRKIQKRLILYAPWRKVSQNENVSLNLLS